MYVYIVTVHVLYVYIPYVDAHQSPVESKAEDKSPATPQSSEVCSTAEIVETDMNGAGTRTVCDTVSTLSPTAMHT